MPLRVATLSRPDDVGAAVAVPPTGIDDKPGVGGNQIVVEGIVIGGYDHHVRSAQQVHGQRDR
jgi:hypothetical protein